MTFEESLANELEVILNNIYPLNAPEGTKAPYVIYTSSEGKNVKCLNGFLNNKEVSCELDLIHNTYSDMKTLAKQVITKVKTFENRVIGTNGPFISELTFDDDSPELYEDQIKKYRKIISFKVNFKEE